MINYESMPAADERLMKKERINKDYRTRKAFLPFCFPKGVTFRGFHENKSGIGIAKEMLKFIDHKRRCCCYPMQISLLRRVLKIKN